MIRALATGAAITCVAVPALARADMPTVAPAATDVDRYRATAAPWWGAVPDPRTIAQGSLAASVTTSVSGRPITLTSATGEELDPPVRVRGTVTAAVSYGATEAIEVGVIVPVVIQSGDRLTAVGDGRELRRATLADVAVAAKYQVVDRAHLAVAVAATLGLPSGNEQHFAGEESWTAEWQGLAALRYGRVSIGAAAGVRLRGEEVRLAGTLVAGNEVTGALAIGVALPAIPGVTCGFDQLRAIGELAGVLGDDVGGERGPSPLEARGGLRLRLWRGWTIGILGGRGLVEEVGAPRWRALVDVAWTDAPSGDWDGDGERDARDRCPLGEC